MGYSPVREAENITRQAAGEQSAKGKFSKWWDKAAGKVANLSMFGSLIGMALFYTIPGFPVLAMVGIAATSIGVGTAARSRLQKLGMVKQEEFVQRVAHASNTGEVIPRKDQAQEHAPGHAPVHNALGVGLRPLNTPDSRQLTGAGQRIG